MGVEHIIFAFANINLDKVIEIAKFAKQKRWENKKKEFKSNGSVFYNK